MTIKITTLLFLLSHTTLALSIKGTVTRIHDGDTITIKSEELAPHKTKKNVRLIGIDTPEIDFNGTSQGEAAFAARDYLRSLLPIGSEVTIDLGRKGSLNSKRLLGAVIYQGLDLNEEMLLSGHAICYFIYPFDKTLLKQYREAAEEAYLSGDSVYTHGIQIPYEFRLEVQNREGTNFVGDMSTKTLYYPDEANLVLPYRRLFIRSLQQARQLGYTLRSM